MAHVFSGDSQVVEKAMNQETITAETLLRDIYQAEAALRWFEQKYALLSEAFYQLYQRGQLRDEDPDEIREYLECYRFGQGTHPLLQQVDIAKL